MKQPLDEQDFQQDEACSSEQQASNSELRVNPGYCLEIRPPYWILAVYLHFKFNAHKRQKPKMKAPDHWPLNSDYIKAQVPSKLLTRSLRRLRTGWLRVSAQLIIRSDYFKFSNKVVTKRDSAEKAYCILFSLNSHSFVARIWKERSIEPEF